MALLVLFLVGITKVAGDILVTPASQVVAEFSVVSWHIDAPIDAAVYGYSYQVSNGKILPFHA